MGKGEGILFRLIEFLKNIIKENKEELKQILWDLLLAIVKMVRENRSKTV